MKKDSRHDPRPILITGAHRSGTTWVGKMISFGENIEYIHEIFNLNHDLSIFPINIKKWFYYLPPSSHDHFVHNAVQNLLNHKRAPLFTSLLKVRSIKQLKLTIRKRGKKISEERHLRLLLKDPIAFFSTEWLVSNFNFIPLILIRHPAAFVSSLKKYNFYHPFEHFIQQPQLMRDRLFPFKSDIFNKPKSILDQAILLWRIIYFTANEYRVCHPEWLYWKYEDLIVDPMEGFKHIYDSLQIQWTPITEQAILFHCADINPVETQNSSLIVRNSKALINIWKTRLSKEEIHYIQEGTIDVWPLFYTSDDW